MGPGDVSCTRMTTLPFLLSGLSPIVIFDSDNPMISCLLCKSFQICKVYFPKVVIAVSVEPCIVIVFDAHFKHAL